MREGEKLIKKERAEEIENDREKEGKETRRYNSISNSAKR
jgi:hypothetical protein